MRSGHHPRSRTLLHRYVSAALSDNRLYVKPLLELIVDYAEFVGNVRTMYNWTADVGTDGRPDFRGIVRFDDDSFLAVDFACDRICRLDIRRPNDLETVGDASAVIGICADKSRPGGYFVATTSSIRYFDGNDLSEVIDGSGKINFYVGISAAMDGTIVVSDNAAGRITAFDGEFRKVVSISFPRKIAFDRSAAKPDSVLIIASADGSIYRYDMQQSLLTTILPIDAGYSPRAVGVCIDGTVIFSCQKKLGIFCVDPAGRIHKLAVKTDRLSSDPDGESLVDADFGLVYDLFVDDRSETAWFVEADRIRVIDLPPHLFRSFVKFGKN